MLKIFDVIKLRRPRKEDLSFFMDVFENDIEGKADLGYNTQYNEEHYMKQYIDANNWEDCYMITALSNTVGFVRTNRNTVLDRIHNISMYLTPEARGKGIGLVALYLYIDILKKMYSFHKLKMGVMGFNKRNLNNFKGITPEYIIHKESLYAGVYYDRYVYSIFGDEWENTWKPFMLDKIQRLEYVWERREEIHKQVRTKKYMKQKNNRLNVLKENSGRTRTGKENHDE